MSTIRQRKTTEHEASVIVGTEKKKSQSQNKDLPVLFVGLLCFRVLNSLAISTFFNPDEFWQSLEVAHNLSFGYGYLTWEWKEGLRSYLHPLIYSFVYAVITTLGLDSPTNIILFPKILNGIFAAVGDFYFYLFVHKEFNESIAKWSLVLMISNWFIYYCIVRSFSNSLETILTCIVLYLWPFSFHLSYKEFKKRKLAICIACIAFIIRPTSAITWIFLGVHQCIQIISMNQIPLLHRVRNVIRFVMEVVAIGITLIGINVVIDWYFFGKGEVVLVPLNFFKFNISKDIGSLYGTHPFHWYFTQGYIAILGSYLPLFLGGIYFSLKRVTSVEWNKLKNSLHVQMYLILWVLGIFSLLRHKEFRFVLPILPLGLLICGYCVYYLLQQFPQKKKAIQMTVGILMFINILPAFYLSNIHQRGSILVMDYIQTLDEGSSVHFLMPCHSTPFYSHVHKNISMQILDCSPSDIPDYIDEADQFKMNPSQFVHKKYSFVKNDGRSSNLPSHFVTFDMYLPALEEFFRSINVGDFSKNMA